MMNTIRFSALVLIAMLVAPVSAHAENLSISIDPMVLEFNAPFGGAEQARVAITNSSSQPELVLSRATDWRTSAEGNVVLEPVGKEDGRSLTGDLQIQPSSFLLHPGETRIVNVSLRMPASGRRDVTSWGGFIVEATGSGSAAPGVTPGGTIFVYNTVGSQPRHIRILHLSSSAIGSGSAVVRADVVNDSQTYVRPVVRLLVERDGNALLNRDVAVNVIFPGQARMLNVPLKKLPPGIYAVHLFFDYGADSILDGVTNVRIP